MRLVLHDDDGKAVREWDVFSEEREDGSWAVGSDDTLEALSLQIREAVEEQEQEAKP